MKAAFFAVLQRLLTYIVAKVMLALGLSFVTYTGFSVGLGYLKNYITSNMASVPSDSFQVLMMAGFGQIVGIIFGAFAFNIAMNSISKLSFVPKGKK